MFNATKNFKVSVVRDLRVIKIRFAAATHHLQFVIYYMTLSS